MVTSRFLIPEDIIIHYRTFASEIVLYAVSIWKWYNLSMNSAKEVMMVDTCEWKRSRSFFE